MYNNYKLEIYEKYGRYYSKFKTDFMGGWEHENLELLIIDPNPDFYEIENREIHLKEQVVTSKLLKVMYNEIFSQ